MLAFGIILFVLGMGSTIYGAITKNDYELQLSSLFRDGKQFPSDIFLYVGLGVAALGLVFIIVGAVKMANKNKQQVVYVNGNPQGMGYQAPPTPAAPVSPATPVAPQAPAAPAAPATPLAPSGAKFCSKCGAKLAPGNLFCTNCGAKIE